CETTHVKIRLTLAKNCATRVRSLFRSSKRATVFQGSEKVNHNPLPNGNHFRAGVYRVAMLFMTLLPALMVLFSPQPASAQTQPQPQPQDGRKPKFSVQPTYPELARKNNIQGSARLQVLVAADGNIKDIKLLGGSPVLVQAAVDAVKKWKYEAASVESTVILKFDFKP